MPAKRIICILSTLLTLCNPLSSFAEMSMTVTTAGDGTFYLVGANVDSVEAVEITVDYDTTFLANPQVGLQGGTFTSISADSPGKLSVNVFRENPDVVLELDMNFEKRGDNPGVINYVTAIMRDTEGRLNQVPVTIISPPPPPVKRTESETAGKEAARGTSTGGAVTKTSHDSRVGQEVSGENIDSGSDRAKVARQPAAGSEKAAFRDFSEEAFSPLSPGRSVLQRFMEYRGEKGLKEFVSLFDGGDRGGIVQEPTVALSDGKTPVRIWLKLEHDGDYSPNFALSDARFVSLHEDGKNSWVMTIVPNQGAWKVRLLIKTGRELIEYPLVVAPPIKIPGNMNDKSFPHALESYLSDQTAKSNGESEPFRQYLHEFIFTANYLAKPAIKSRQQASR